MFRNSRVLIADSRSASVAGISDGKEQRESGKTMHTRGPRGAQGIKIITFNMEVIISSYDKGVWTKRPRDK